MEDQLDSGTTTMQQQQQHDDFTDKERSTEALEESGDLCNLDTDNPTEKSTCFRLLELPLENRQQSLHIVLPQTFIHPSRGPLWELGSTALFRTCQQLHVEGTSILYSTNTFVIRIFLHRHPHLICPLLVKRFPRKHSLAFPVLASSRRRGLQLIRKFELENKGV